MSRREEEKKGQTRVIPTPYDDEWLPDRLLLMTAALDDDERESVRHINLHDMYDYSAQMGLRRYCGRGHSSEQKRRRRQENFFFSDSRHVVSAFFLYLLLSSHTAAAASLQPAVQTSNKNQSEPTLRPKPPWSPVLLTAPCGRP